MDGAPAVSRQTPTRATRVNATTAAPSFLDFRMIVSSCTNRHWSLDSSRYLRMRRMRGDFGLHAYRERRRNERRGLDRQLQRGVSHVPVSPTSAIATSNHN